MKIQDGWDFGKYIGLSYLNREKKTNDANNDLAYCRWCRGRWKTIHVWYKTYILCQQTPKKCDLVVVLWCNPYNFVSVKKTSKYFRAFK